MPAVNKLVLLDLEPNSTFCRELVPEKEDSLAKALGEADRRYTRYINFREGWRGYLWQGPFASYPMDESYLLAAARYIELNPVRPDWSGDLAAPVIPWF